MKYYYLFLLLFAFIVIIHQLTGLNYYHWLFWGILFISYQDNQKLLQKSYIQNSSILSDILKGTSFLIKFTIPVMFFFLLFFEDHYIITGWSGLLIVISGIFNRFA